MFVVKFQYKDSKEPMYSNRHTMAERKEIRANDMIKMYSLSKDEAYNLYNNLISRNLHDDMDMYGYSSWHQPKKELAYIAVVDLSHYPPYSEYQVIEYREFQ